MNQPKVSLDIHLYFLCYHLQFKSSDSQILPFYIYDVSIMTKWAFFVTQSKNFPKQTYPRHFPHYGSNMQKRSKLFQSLLRQKNRIHMLSDSFSCVVEIATFSLIPIYHRYYHLSSATTRHFVYTFLPYKIRTGRLAARDACTSANITLTQPILPAIDSKTFTIQGSLLLLSRIRTVPPPPDDVKRWAHFHRDGSLGA